MSGVLHPVGPEPEQTYWLRRALVLGTALLLVLGVVLLANRAGSGTASAAPPPVVVAATASPTVAASDGATPTAKSSAASQPTKTPAPTSKQTSTAKKSSPAKKSSTAKKSTAKPKPTAPVACAPAALRTTLTGKERLKPKQHATFKLSVINGSGATCVVKVNPADFSLTIYSGRDRIWTSAHCARSVKPITKKVGAEGAVEWSMAWNGRRSAKDCKNRSEIPRPGTYEATAQLDGAKAVKMRMILRG